MNGIDKQWIKNIPKFESSDGRRLKFSDEFIKNKLFFYYDSIYDCRMQYKSKNIIYITQNKLLDETAKKLELSFN